MVVPEEAEELARQAREGRARLLEQMAGTHLRVGDLQHAAETTMHRVADKPPDPENVHRRADRLSEQADEHLRRAEQERAAAGAEKRSEDPSRRSSCSDGGEAGA